jgi:hypothetical protein
VTNAKRLLREGKDPVRLTFAPGEAYQFDWSHEIVLINGTTVTVKVAHARLCQSWMMPDKMIPLHFSVRMPPRT